jgi:hypothetical protein
METVPNPRLLLGRWFKASPIADQTHCIVRYDGTLLIAYCGCKIPLKDASRVINGARHCVDCEGLRRKHLAAKTSPRSGYAATRK